MGVNSISFAPFKHLGSNVDGHQIYRFACGSSDNLLRIYRFTCGGNESTWMKEYELQGHKDWIRTVAWAPTCGLPNNTIASGGQDKKVIIWTQENDKWIPKKIELNGIVWGLSWNHSAQTLAVSSGDESVCLLKQNIDTKEWEATPVS